MRVKFARAVLFLMLTTNFILIYWVWKFLVSTKISTNLNLIYPSPAVKKNNSSIVLTQPNKKLHKHIKNEVTVVFRDFYDFENDLKESIASLRKVFPLLKIILIYDKVPYPPLEILNYTDTSNRIELLSLETNLENLNPFSQLLDNIKTPLTLLMPDSVRISSRYTFRKILEAVDYYQDKSSNHLFIVPFKTFNKKAEKCDKVVLDLPNWTIEYTSQTDTKVCGFIPYKHAILLRTNLMKQMVTALASPFPERFFITAKFLKNKLQLLNTAFADGRPLFTAYQHKQNRNNLKKLQLKEMYNSFRIKKVVHHEYPNLKTNVGKKLTVNDQLAVFNEAEKTKNFNNKSHYHGNGIQMTSTITFYGCEKKSKSCIGKVYDRKPFYTYIGRNIPPCCYEKLKTVFLYVVEELENFGIRYWLDNEALHDAVDAQELSRSKSRYEIDVSFNALDVNRHPQLIKAQVKPFTDEKGFHWIKATDGNYFKVFFSKPNQIGVNLLPYNISTKDKKARANGFFGWKAKTFSLDFLHPMSTILFFGRHVACPNNVREYLSIKQSM